MANSAPADTTEVIAVFFQSAYRAVATGVSTNKSHIGPQNVPSIYTSAMLATKASLAPAPVEL